MFYVLLSHTFRSSISSCVCDRVKLTETDWNWLFFLETDWNQQEASITWCDLFRPKFAQKCPTFITSHDVLEPFKQVRHIISGQICGSKLQRVFTSGDGCWLPMNLIESDWNIDWNWRKHWSTWIESPWKSGDSHWNCLKWASEISHGRWGQTTPNMLEWTSNFGGQSLHQWCFQLWKLKCLNRQKRGLVYTKRLVFKGKRGKPYTPKSLPRAQCVCVCVGNLFAQHWWKDFGLLKLTRSFSGMRPPPACRFGRGPRINLE